MKHSGLAAAALAVAGLASGQQKGEPATKPDILFKKLEARIEEIAARLDGVMGVAILDLSDGRRLLRNAEQVFPTASSIKLPLLIELYRQEQQSRAGARGKARLGDLYTFDAKDLVDGSTIMAGLTPGVSRITNRDLAQFMIAVSDNAATNVLYERVGKDSVNFMLRGLGLERTLLRRRMMDLPAARRGDENVATPREMVSLLEALHAGKLLDKELTASLLEQLSTAKDSWLQRDLPEGVRVANKHGTLDAVRSDCGIVYAPNRPFAIAVMTSFVRDERSAEAAISQVALAAYRFFEMLGKTSEHGRELPPVAR